MEQLIGFRVVMDGETVRGYLAVGRLFGAVEYEPYFEQVRSIIPADLRERVISVEACLLSELSDAPYFYEGLAELVLVCKGRRFGRIQHLLWLRRRRSALSSGAELYLVGKDLPLRDYERA